MVQRQVIMRMLHDFRVVCWPNRRAFGIDGGGDRFRGKGRTGCFGLGTPEVLADRGNWPTITSFATRELKGLVVNAGFGLLDSFAFNMHLNDALDL